ncbi:pilus assembly protein PilP [Amphritea opalescens]|uniref:Pilus assembly protein PilP n=1 Tax=Amphritea opalescens TaxID=2490544 RepID=A0A430KUP8_9GAMM|nr:pilus assembly protein PilP [Amphritea opalescens]RTE67245.1 pilus assembly protein PilP [Amphritea opalescens]
MMIPSKFLRVLILAPLFLGGCVWIEDVSDLRSFIAQEKQKKVIKVEPLPEFTAYHSFVYEGASMRSPFKPLVSIITVDTEEGVADEGNTGIKPDLDRERSYLETFSLDNLAMVGSINMSATGSRWALIKDKQGEVHRVSVGDYMGLDYGKVVAVNSDNVELVEIVTNGRGGWMRRPRSVVMD